MYKSTLKYPFSLAEHQISMSLAGKCQPKYVGCFETAFEIDSESRLNDNIVNIYFLINISVLKMH